MDKLFLGLIIVFIAAFTLFISTLLRSPVTQITRAIEDKSVSPQQSLIFVWPLQLKADGKSVATITVFVRNSKTEAISGKRVNIISSLGNVTQNQNITDKDGKAVFQLSSISPGIAEIEAIIDNTKIAKKLSINFE